jgi:hypothetical protein
MDIYGIKCTWKVATHAAFWLKIVEDNEQWPDDASSSIIFLSKCKTTQFRVKLGIFDQLQFIPSTFNFIRVYP